MGLPLRCLQRASLPIPHFVVFAFVKESRSPLTTIVFQFFGLVLRMGTGPDENPNISTSPCQFSSDFGIDEGVWSDGLQMVWNGALVNAQLITS
ncbi:hypothetical protein AVEN_118773-1 [Araneus ventricosus]|uniref:Uncharacterized protein n=1 Tax=Araneus ventricosus TaxID=182803 RepID=A0A4Y2BY45_ARAVE|nr:hypothetical protein AVEN_118773-1 [Araneus ventricosus]